MREEHPHCQSVQSLYCDRESTLQYKLTLLGGWFRSLEGVNQVP